MLKFIILIILSLNSFAQEKKLTVFFLNGVLNNRTDAEKSAKVVLVKINNHLPLASEINEKINAGEVLYTYAYNQSEFLLDFYETVAQKIYEARPGLTEREAYKLLASIIFKGGVTGSFF